MLKRAKNLLQLLILILLSGCAERSIDSALESHNKGTVPYVKVMDMAAHQADYILDTRELDEFEVSHIPKSIWVGYKSFSIDKVQTIIPEKNKRIVVYCSVGVRSEDIGEILLENGYSDVKNLYGGIFEWKNRGMKVIDAKGKETQNVHAYSKFWGRLLTDANKVY